MLLLTILVACCYTISAHVTQESGAEKVAIADHNKKRAIHHAQALRWDHILENKALESAKAWANGEDMKTFGYGRNGFWTGFLDTSEAPYLAAAASWYSKGDLYDYESTDIARLQTFGTFTQMVWNDSTNMGIAGYKTDRKWYVVALYSPPGNYNWLGAFKKNVLKP